MTTIPPERFTVAYFRNVYKTSVRKDCGDDVLERERIGAAFRKTHREPRVLTREGMEWAMVWNAISCTCCILSSQPKNIHGCEGSNESIIEKAKQAKDRNKPYDFIFLTYEEEKHADIDKLILEIAKVSPETKLFLLTLRDEQLAEELRCDGYFAMSGMDMMLQTKYDMIIAETFGDEGISNMENWFGKKVAYYNFLAKEMCRDGE